MENISLEQARVVALAAQGLLRPRTAPAQKADVAACIRQMGLLQIDTIHVIARSPYLVLFNRLGDYPPAWLDESLAEGALFEYWGHAACFIPIEDYFLYRRAMLEGRFPHYIAPEWLESRAEMKRGILERIRTEGPLKSSDFTGSKRPGAWWSWKDEKNILERLFNEGRLMIRRREKFQRVYDLSERVLPGWTDEKLPEMEEIFTILAARTVRHLGLTSPEWISDYYRLPKRAVPAIVDKMVRQGELKQIRVTGFEKPWVYTAENQTWLEQACAGALNPTLSAILSPFDPLVWDRARTRGMFHFDFSLEAYLPASKRRFGYFCLPVLSRGRLVGRMDAKAHRREKRFEVKNLALEPGVEPDDLLLDDLSRVLKSTAAWHGCPEVNITACEPSWLGEKLSG